MGRFSAKLDDLPSTVEMCLSSDIIRLSEELRAGQKRPALAVGSGGSLISAEYFRRCRETCGFARTAVETCMQFATDMSGLSGTDVWLFTAGANNADMRAAVQSAYQRGATQVFMLTCSADGRAATELAELGGLVFNVEVSDHKDGFLATHSLVATVTTLLLAFDSLTDVPSGAALAVKFKKAVEIELSDAAREKHRDSVSALRSGDTLFVLSDPHLGPVSSLIDTSVWEASICNIQSTDFRNFAHGRHTWLHHRPETSFVVALTGRDWFPVHSAVLSLIPSEVRKSTYDFGNCGRFENAVGIVTGLALIEAMGHAVQIDPGKPGVGTFGRELYDNDSLWRSVQDLKPAVRHKCAAVLKQDAPTPGMADLTATMADRLKVLQSAIIGAIVLDYDGTFVDTERRFEPPRSDIIEEILRLHKLGIAIALATGRGGSVGEDLRKIFNQEVQEDILIGYYNGAYLQPLNVDIDVHRPDEDKDITQAIDWMKCNQHLFRKFDLPKHGVQIAIQRSNLVSVSQFELEIGKFIRCVNGRLRLDRSAHSFDLVVARASKLNVVRAVRERVPEDAVVLRLGDSGTVTGNDYELILPASGISVDAVCPNAEGSWSLFGHIHTGPEALKRILTSLIPSGSGCVQFAPTALRSDK